MADREAAERELTDLLNRALRSVPYVRLDVVDDVLKSFQSCVDLMELNLELDEDDDGADPDEPATEEDGDEDESEESGAGARDSQRAKLVGLARDGSGSDSGREGEERGFVPTRGISNKLLGLSVTRDYSSPRSARRSLNSSQGSKRAPSTRVNEGEAGAAPDASTGRGLGLGLGKAKPGVGLPGAAAAAAAAAHAHSSAAKPSSRASVSSSALSSTTAGSTMSAQDEKESGEGKAGAGPLLPKNKLLSRATAGTREFPSPKLGPRSLGGGASPAPNATAALPPATTFEQSESSAPGALSASPDDEDDDDDDADLLKAKSAKDPLNRLRETEAALPITASPKQFKSSLKLLTLAASPTLEGPRLLEGGAPASALAGAGPTGTGAAPLTANQALIAHSSVGAAGGIGLGVSPKPGFLRRLDSPDTHHGQLLAAKARLQMIINRCQQHVPNVRQSAMPRIKAAIADAVAKLEAACVTNGVSAIPAGPTLLD